MVHFGFWVDDLMEIRRRLKDLGAECVESHEVKDTQSGHFEDKWKGPDGTLFDVTNTGFPGALPPQREQARLTRFWRRGDSSRYSARQPDR